MGQGSLLAQFAYGALTFRLRFAYGPDSFFSGFPNPFNFTIWYTSRQSVKLDLKVISHTLKNSLTAALQLWNFIMTYVKPYGNLTNFSKKLTTGKNSSKRKMWPIHMEFRTLLRWWLNLNKYWSWRHKSSLQNSVKDPGIRYTSHINSIHYGFVQNSATPNDHQPPK